MPITLYLSKTRCDVVQTLIYFISHKERFSLAFICGIIDFQTKWKNLDVNTVAWYDSHIGLHCGEFSGVYQLVRCAFYIELYKIVSNISF